MFGVGSPFLVGLGKPRGKPLRHVGGVKKKTPYGADSSFSKGCHFQDPRFDMASHISVEWIKTSQFEGPSVSFPRCDVSRELW